MPGKPYQEIGFKMKQDDSFRDDANYTTAEALKLQLEMWERSECLPLYTRSQ